MIEILHGWKIKPGYTKFIRQPYTMDIFQNTNESMLKLIE